ncbi:MAG: hypothetical protein E7L38_21825 [Klebsiella pneumoniae]|nr:hypothetical protein [Klebsiella pneumoniae]
MTASIDDPPPPPAEASRCSSNELQISSAIRMMCSATEMMIARLSLSFCSVAFDTIGSQKLFACIRDAYRRRAIPATGRRADAPT